MSGPTDWILRNIIFLLTDSMPLGSKVCWVSNGQVWLCVPDVLVNAVPVYVIDISSHCRSNRDELPSFLNTEYSQVQILGAIQVLGNTMGGGWCMDLRY